MNSSGIAPSSSWPRYLLAVLGLLLWLDVFSATTANQLLPYRDEIERGYNARNSQAIDDAVAALKKEPGLSAAELDVVTYYAAFARLRQSALPGIGKERAKDYLEQCIGELEPLIARRADYAQARALYASCLGASANHYVLRAATRGMAAGREMAAAVKQAPADPWVVFQDGVSDFLTPAVFGGNNERALGKLKRAEQLFVASRPDGSTEPVFGESEAWLYIGRIHRAIGRNDEARQALEKARSLAPASADVRDELAKL